MPTHFINQKHLFIYENNGCVHISIMFIMQNLINSLIVVENVREYVIIHCDCKISLTIEISMILHRKQSVIKSWFFILQKNYRFISEVKTIPYR